MSVSVYGDIHTYPRYRYESLLFIYTCISLYINICDIRTHKYIIHRSPEGNRRGPKKPPCQTIPPRWCLPFPPPPNSLSSFPSLTDPQRPKIQQHTCF